MYELLGATVDSVHGLAMIAWGLGLPLLFWHRWRRLTRAYVIYSVAFILISVGSHVLLGECLLTRLARELYDAGHHPELRDQVSFIVRATEAVAGIRPNERWAVLVWEGALLIGSAGLLLHLRRERSREKPPRGGASRPAV